VIKIFRVSLIQQKLSWGSSLGNWVLARSSSGNLQYSGKMKFSIGLFVLLSQSCSGFHAPPAFGVATSSCSSSLKNHEMVLPSSTALPATMLAQSVDLAEASSSKLREAPLDKYRNIGIMAHIDAGKCSSQFYFWVLHFIPMACIYYG
jgi:hypothetical protein